MSSHFPAAVPGTAAECHLPVPSSLWGCRQSGGASPVRPDLEHTETKPRRGQLHIMQGELQHAGRHILPWSLHRLVVPSLLPALDPIHQLLQALLSCCSCCPGMGQKALQQGVAGLALVLLWDVGRGGEAGPPGVASGPAVGHHYACVGRGTLLAEVKVLMGRTVSRDVACVAGRGACLASSVVAHANHGVGSFWCVLQLK